MKIYSTSNKTQYIFEIYDLFHHTVVLSDKHHFIVKHAFGLFPTYTRILQDTVSCFYRKGHMGKCLYNDTREYKLVIYKTYKLFHCSKYSNSVVRIYGYIWLETKKLIDSENFILIFSDIFYQHPLCRYATCS